MDSSQEVKAALVLAHAAVSAAVEAAVTHLAVEMAKEGEPHRRPVLSLRYSPELRPAPSTSSWLARSPSKRFWLVTRRTVPRSQE